MSLNKIRFAVLGSLIIVISILGSVGESQATVLKFATVIPEGVPGWAQLKNTVNGIQKQTKGTVNIKLYGGGIAGDEIDVIRKMRVGRIHMAQFAGVGVGMILPEMRVIEAPGLFQSYEQADYVNDKLFDYFAPRLEKKGFVLLGLTEAGFVYLFSKKDMTRTDGLGTLKMWTWKGDPVSHLTMEKIGLPVTPLHISDVNVGLQTGLIDSFYGPPVAVAAFQWYAQVPYCLDYKITRSMVCYLMTRNAFRKMPEEHQETIRDVFKAFARETTKITRESNADSRRIMTDSGIKFQAPPLLLVEKLNSGSDEAINEMIKRGIFNRKVYEDIKGMLAGYPSIPEGVVQ